MILRIKKNTKGFSLLELILAITIFSLSSVALALLLIDSGISTKLSLERGEALFYAKEGMEAVRSVRNNVTWSGFSAGNHGLLNAGGIWSFDGASDLIDNKYTRVITISSVSTNTKNVSINISWVTPIKTYSATIDTVFTNWENK